jgi:hypothetical protein
MLDHHLFQRHQELKPQGSQLLSETADLIESGDPILEYLMDHEVYRHTLAQLLADMVLTCDIEAEHYEYLASFIDGHMAMVVKLLRDM